MDSASAKVKGYFLARILAPKPDSEAEQKHAAHEGHELVNGCGTRGITRGTRTALTRGTSADPTLLQETVVMTLKEEGFDLAHRIEDNTHRNEHAGATEEDCDPLGDIQLEEQNVREYRNGREEDRTR